MNDIIDIIDLVIAMWGVVLIYTGFSCRITGNVNKYVLWDKKVPFSKCRNKRGYIKYVSWRMIVAGIVILIMGLFGMFSTKYSELYDKYYNIALLITLGVLAWYGYFSWQANKKFY